LRIIRSFVLSSRTASIGLTLLVFVLVVVFLGPIVWPFDALRMNPDAPLLGPSWPHILGTDNFGRDLLSRTMQGGRVSIAIAFSAVLVAGFVGFWIGTVSGFYRGWADLALQRIVDALLSIPSLLLAIGLIAVLGTGLASVVVAIAAVFVARVARVARASALSVRELDYVEAARAIGVPSRSIVVRHIARNVLGPTIAITTVALGEAILVEASMSFLGLGVSLPDPSWGNMLTGDSRTYFYAAPHLVIVPGLALALTVFAVNMVGDALGDLNNPRLLSKAR
jgi:peptide/nickel transport system permease protein